MAKQLLQNVEFRLRKLEDVAEQTMNHLAVIHRFMATHPSLVNRGSTDTLGPPPPTFQSSAVRLRTASDRSEVRIRQMCIAKIRHIKKITNIK